MIISIESKLYDIRGCKVMLDSDLAEYYGMKTKSLNQAVKRNSDLFPEDFMFQLTDKEFITIKETSTLKGREIHRKYNPTVYTKKGAIKVASTLNPKRGKGFSYPIKDILINEKVLEEYIKQYPKVFLDLDLSLVKQQESLYGLVPDLSFEDKDGNILITEIQLGYLDRYHLYKSLEYRDLYQIKYQNKKADVAVFCNGLENNYIQILKIHNINIHLKSEQWIYDTMKSVDGFKTLSEFKEKASKNITMNLDEVINRIETAFR